DVRDLHGHLLRLLLVTARQRDAELVAAASEEPRAWRPDSPGGPCDLLQEAVALCVRAGIIAERKVVDVKDHERERLAIVERAVHDLRQTLLGVAMAERVGEVIGAGGSSRADRAHRYQRAARQQQRAERDERAARGDAAAGSGG